MARETLEFVKAALRRPFEVSTVFPTSKSLAETLLDHADVRSAQSVVELGAGTGAITRYLEPRLAPDASYLGIELDVPMVEFLREEWSHLRFEAGLAESLLEWVEPGSVDVVVSSLPWTVFSDATQTRTIQAILTALKPNGRFSTYVCANALWYPQARAFVRRLNEGFTRVEKSDLEWRNIPPAYVFTSVK